MLKFFEINSIRSRMVTGFLFLTLLILVLAIVSLFMVNRTSEVAQVHGNINQLQILTLNLIKCDNDFFDHETSNEYYFKRRKSKFLTRRDSINAQITFELRELREQVPAEGNTVSENLQAIDSTLARYNSSFQKLEDMVFKKGFKDYGIEGAMRTHAHLLEKECPTSFKLSVLYLRRHEKDFLLRNDTTYLNLFTEKSTKLLEVIQHNPDQKNTSIHLQDYHRLLFELADIQQRIGFTSQHGLRNELNIVTNSLSDQFLQVSGYSYNQASKAYSNAFVFYVLMLSGATLFSIITGYWISKKLSEPIARLSKLVNEAILSKTITKTDFSLRNAATEINDLTGSFIMLINQDKVQLNEIKKKSKLVRRKNKELRQLNRELDNFLYSTAHDLRSPLSSLLGLITLMRYEVTHPNINHYLDMMENSINRSEMFIGQIVSYAKNKRSEIVPEKIDLATILNDVYGHHQYINQSEKIRRIASINQPEPFISDKSRITVIFNNLVSNAIKYADLEKAESFIRITINVTAEEASIEFADNGVGIENEHLSKIFNMFYRANYNSTGSGLGLFIFKETLTRLKGYASVESAAGTGTTFFIRIPNLQRQQRPQQALAPTDQLRDRRASIVGT